MKNLDNPQEKYLNIMRLIRDRFDLMDFYTQETQMSFLGAGTIAFNARKILEAISFAFLVAIDNSIGTVPPDIKNTGIQNLFSND